MSRSFIERVCFALNQVEEELFLTPGSTGQCVQPENCAASAIGQWLQEKCQKERLSMRQAAAKTGLCHATISDIIKGTRPLSATIKKLAQGFGGDGMLRLALEDRLLVLAGYEREEPCLKIIPLLSPEHQHILEALARELAKIEGIEVPASERGDEE